MKLPKDCRFATLSADEIYSSETEPSGCCRAAGWHRLARVGEPLCRSQQSEKEAYRFYWDSSFHGSAVVNVGRNEASITLRWQYFAFVPQTAGTVALAEADWQKLQHAITVAQFWSLDSAYELPMGFDGANWLIEGRRRDVYNAVHRWSPHGAIHELGKLLFGLAGPPLDKIKLY